ncbi:MAG: glycosyltransferase family 2 protein [Clostridia bacterium]|nr:glycosyltransferase family 2 protein [Clostridia bacterium]
MNLADYLTLFAMVAIWALMAINVFLSVGGFLYYYKMERQDPNIPLEEYPFVSVMVPAHNESAVIQRTVRALLRFDYPADRYEIIVINDNSSDDTAEKLAAVQAEHPDRKLVVVNTDNQLGGKGKSNALNIGFSVAKGTVLAIYDADNTPEPRALRILVEHLMADESLGAVIGKFRTRNRNASLLTRFVNIETLAHQCMNQAGRWFYFGLCTIPGTNFVIHRHIIEKIGGWDPQALSEDTEISFRIYRMGYKIRQVPQAVTWEQEPFRLDIWMKQRTRWAMGNLYVLMNNFKYVFDPHAGKMRLDVLYYTMVYFLMATALICSDTIFVLGVLGYCHVSLGGLSTLVWVMACLLFECNIMLTLSTEKNEFNMESVFLVLLMLFTYAKLWVVVVVRAAWMTFKKMFTKQEVKWYKTERSAD